MDTSVTIPENLLWIVIGIGVIVQFLREFEVVNTYKRFIPYFCIALGTVGAYFDGSGWPGCIQMGVAIGLMSAGGYDAITAFSGAKKSTAAAATTTAALVCVLLLIGGCTSPLFTFQQKALLSQSSIVVTELNTRCQAGDDQACKEGLAKAAETLSILAADGTTATDTEGAE